MILSPASIGGPGFGLFCLGGCEVPDIDRPDALADECFNKLLPIFVANDSDLFDLVVIIHLKGSMFPCRTTPLIVIAFE